MTFWNKETVAPIVTFCDAAARGDEKLVRKLLAEMPTLVHLTHPGGGTALCFAAAQGKQEIVSLLLARGAKLAAPELALWQKGAFDLPLVLG